MLLQEAELVSTLSNISFNVCVEGCRSPVVAMLSLPPFIQKSPSEIAFALLTFNLVEM